MTRYPRISLALPVHGRPFASALEVALAAEAAGFDGIFVPDHLINLNRPTAGVLECWTVLAGVAAATRRVHVGPLVLVTPFRHPPLLAKQVGTLDSIAPGRIVLGLGSGGFTYDATCEALGFEPLLPGARVAHVESTIVCLRTQLGAVEELEDGSVGFVYPRPTHPVPIIVAARRPRMLQVAARLADGWNCPLPHELEIGLAALADHGRERSTIEVSVYVVAVVAESDAAARRNIERAGRAAQMFGDVERHHLWGGPARVRERIADFVRRGADHLVLDLRGAPHSETIDLLAREVLPHLAG